MKGGAAVEDEQILELFRQRDESAIRETERKYGKYLTKIAYGILANAEDSRESVSDAYLSTWNSIPPPMAPACSPRILPSSPGGAPSTSSVIGTGKSGGRANTPFRSTSWPIA